jgi:hypothetical protein
LSLVGSDTLEGSLGLLLKLRGAKMKDAEIELLVLNVQPVDFLALSKYKIELSKDNNCR